jgi:hypothetical protein
LQPFTISILLTKEDLVADAPTTARRVGWLSIAGALLAVAGLVMPRLSAGFPAAAASGLFLLGVLLVVYETLLAPLFSRLRAAARFEEQEMLRQTVMLTVSDDAMLVESARIGGTLTRAELTDAAESDALFRFTFGTQVTLRVPKRLLSEEQTLWLRQWKGR